MSGEPGPASFAALRNAVLQGPRAAAVASRRPACVVPLGRRRHGVRRRVHGPGRCQSDADAAAQARARFPCAAQHRELGGGGLHPDHGVVHADLRPVGRHDRPQAALYRRLPAVRHRLGPVRLRAGPAHPDRLPHHPGHWRRTDDRQQHRHRRPCGGPRASRPRARPAVGGAGDRARGRTGGGRPGARHAGLALGVLDQRAVRNSGLASRLVRAAADPASEKRRPLRLAWRIPDRARAHRHRRGAERGPCLGRDLARLHLLQRGRGRPAGVVRPGRTARRHAADRLRAAAPARVRDRQPRELPVLRRAVRGVLPDPLRRWSASTRTSSSSPACASRSCR